MANTLYNKGLEEFFKGNIDLVNDTINLMLVDQTHTPSKANSFVADVVADELSGTGYSRKTLGTKAVATVANVIRFTAADPSWTGLNAGEINGAIIFKQVTNDADSILIAYLEITNLVTNGSDVTIEFTDDVVLSISNA